MTERSNLAQRIRRLPPWAADTLLARALKEKLQRTVDRIYHLDRGYDRMEDRLNALGASIQRVDEKELAGAATV